MSLLVNSDANKINELPPWRPSELLEAIEPRQLRYSAGFLCAKPAVWFSGMRNDWNKFLDILGKSVEVRKIQTVTELPTEPLHYVTIDINGEPAVLAVDQFGIQTLCALMQVNLPDVAQEIFLEYLARRFVTTLQKAWNEEKEAFAVLFVESGDSSSLVVDGGICIELGVGNDSISIWIGLSPVTVDKIDSLWKEKKWQALGLGTDATNEEVSVSINLVELAVPPSLLIDYLRAGAIIDLSIPISSRVSLNVNGASKAVGELSRIGDTFAVKSLAESEQDNTLPPGTTRLGVEIARLEMDSLEFFELVKSQGSFETNQPISNKVSLIIGQEEVAQGLLSVLDNRFVLKVI